MENYEDSNFSDKRRKLNTRPIGESSMVRGENAMRQNVIMILTVATGGSEFGRMCRLK